jgi:deoxyadenosine/deoxycytidine kinase
MGSGKSTLAQGLAPLLGMTCVKESGHGKAYLLDLQRDRGRWAFETQVSFLCHKATAVLQALSNDQRIIVDRSLSEDCDIFAKLFADSGAIAQRSFELYTHLASHFTTSLPSADMTIYCHVSTATCLARIRARQRDDVTLHTLEHIEDLARRYELWASNLQGPVLHLDSETNDWRRAEVLRSIAEQVWQHTSLQSKLPTQLDMFPTIGDSAPAIRAQPAGERPNSPHAMSPQVYIAVPFTAKAAAPNVSLALFENPHGNLPRSYRRFLVNIEQRLRACGFRTFLPHRDINQWGRKIMSSKQVYDECLSSLESCDALVAIPDTSHGVHLELGMALGLGLPTAILHSEDTNVSFIASGVNSSARLLALSAPRRSLIPELLSSSGFKSFMNTFFDLNGISSHAR